MSDLGTFEEHRIEDHQAFILGQLIPLLREYACISGVPPEVVAAAAFMALATILQTQGLDRDALMLCIDAARLEIHDIPEGLH